MIYEQRTRFSYPGYKDDARYTQVIPIALSKDKRNFSRLVQRIFDRMKAVFHSDAGDDPEESVYSTAFYGDCYQEPEVKIGGPDGETVSIESSEAPQDSLMGRLTARPGPIGRNKLFFLLGEVGVGKTALVNWLITQKFKEFVEPEKIWFVRIDLENISPSFARPKHELICDIIRALQSVIDRNRAVRESLGECHDELTELWKSLEAPDLASTAMESGAEAGEYLLEYRCKALQAAIQKVETVTKRRLILIFDNLDYLFHLFDYRLYQDQTEGTEIDIYQATLDFISFFNRKDQLGFVGANVIIVLRYNNYQALKASIPATSANPVSLEGEEYYVKCPTLRVAVEARCKLLQKIAENQEYEGKRERYLQIPQLIRTDLERNRGSLASHLLGITNGSLRDVMVFFKQYGWVDGDYGVELPRLIENQPLGLMAFMLGGKLAFSEEYSRFPNIYLVDGEPSREESAAVRHSYWLKYLLMEFIFKKGKIPPSYAREVFFAGGQGYDEWSINDCLGNLTDQSSSYCVRAQRSPNPGKVKSAEAIIDISLNRRGKHCLRNLFDRFFYLQLIIEDYNLPLPSALDEIFARHRSGDGKSKPNTPNYGYIVKDSPEYEETMAKMIKMKARQVIIFLKVVEVSLKFERQMFPSVFEILQRDGVRIPDVQRIRINVVRELEKLNSKALGGTISIKRHKEEAESLSGLICNELEKVYSAHS